MCYRTLELEAGTLAFTYCQVPIVYRNAEEKMGLTLYLAEGSSRSVDGLVLDEASSREIFTRSGRIERLEVALTPGLDG